MGKIAHVLAKRAAPAPDSNGYRDFSRIHSTEINGEIRVRGTSCPDLTDPIGTEQPGPSAAPTGPWGACPSGRGVSALAAFGVGSIVCHEWAGSPPEYRFWRHRSTRRMPFGQPRGLRLDGGSPGDPGPVLRTAGAIVASPAGRARP